MDAMRITVFGGSGFLGRTLVRRLLRAGHVVRVAARRPDSRFLADPEARERLEAMAVNIADAAAVRLAVQGADAVFNLVGAVFLPTVQAYFELHEHGAGTVGTAAREAGTRRLVHISALGASAGAPSAADRSKAAGEVAVRLAFPEATVVRPSLLFGADDHFFTQIEAVSRLSPVLPLVGADTRIQPLHVDDLAAALQYVVEHPATAGRTYEAGGPRVYALQDAVQRFLKARGWSRLVVPVPYAVAGGVARVTECLPNPPLNREQVNLLRTDKVASPSAAGLAELGVEPRTFEAWLETRA